MPGERGQHRPQLGEGEVLADATARPRPKGRSARCASAAPCVARRVEAQRVGPHVASRFIPRRYTVATWPRRTRVVMPADDTVTPGLFGVRGMPHTAGLRRSDSSTNARCAAGVGAQPRPFLGRACALHDRPRERGAGRLVAGQEEAEHVAAQLVGAERAPARSGGQQRAEDVVVVGAVCARAITSSA